MRPILTLAILGLAALGAATSALAAGEVYKWTDDAGVVQYTDYAPANRAFEKLKTPGSKAATPVPEAAAPEAAAEAAPVADAPAQGSADANCAAARQNVDNISRFADVTMDRDGDGTPEKRTAEQRIEELRRNEQLVSLYCPKDAAAADGQ